MIPTSLLNKLRTVSDKYHLANTLEVYRTDTNIDGSGGITNIDRLVAETPGRVIAKVFSEEQEGGGLAGNTKWLVVVPSQFGIMPDDKIIIRDDVFSDRYFLVIASDAGQTEGLFTSMEAIERWN